jgi:periplasmic divalent cation tolerance protein
MLIAWTTVASREEAEKLAESIVTERLAVCAQIDGPITSLYTWEGRVERNEEYRLMFKLLPAQATTLEARVIELHPYDVPEWLMVSATHVGEKYLSWARASSTSSPL